MTKRFADNIKHLREAKNVSQEKMAQALNVSFQAVSKWETGKSLPDISLLPLISRYFGITIDELLMVDQLDEKLLFEQYQAEAESLHRAGKVRDTIPLWLEALQQMPNNVVVKDMLMGAYFDTDVVAYSKEIVELGAEIYRNTDDSYYQGHAICLLARTYAAVGNVEKAKEWAKKAHSIINAREFLEVENGIDPECMVSDFRFDNYWYLMHLFYMAVKVGQNMSDKEANDLYRSVAAAFDALGSLARQDEDLQEKRRILDTLLKV